MQNRAAELAAQSGAAGVVPAVITVSVDEKPGVQALAHTAPDLPPVAGQHARVARDYEYKRCGTLSILAALDLHDMWWRGWRPGIAAGNSWPCSRIWTPITRRRPPPRDSRQSFGAHFQRNLRLSGGAAQPLSVCAYTQTWLLAELGRDAVWQNGAHFPAPHPGGFQSGAQRTHPAGDRGAQRRYSRDHRPDCKQIIIALVVTPEGFPLAYEVFEGNRADVTTLEEMLEAVERKHGRARRVWVFDRGIVSEENLERLRRRGASYLVGTPRAQLKAYERRLLEGDWQSVSCEVEVQRIARTITRPTCWPAAGRGRRKKARCVPGSCAA